MTYGAAGYVGVAGLVSSNLMRGCRDFGCAWLWVETWKRLENSESCLGLTAADVRRRLEPMFNHCCPYLSLAFIANPTLSAQGALSS